MAAPLMSTASLATAQLIAQNRGVFEHMEKESESKGDQLDQDGDEDLDEVVTEEEAEQPDEETEPPTQRNLNAKFPDTVTKLETPDGAQVFLVGTAHFSDESRKDVALVIRATRPDYVMVELCKSRMHIMSLDEETLMREAKTINSEKIRQSIKEHGAVQGVLQILLLSLSAHVTKELGMAPGGEFRTALQEAHKVPNCRLFLGDRPVQITMKRALAPLSLWQRLKLGWSLLSSYQPINKEEVERLKQRDMLEELLREMAGEFPALNEVFVTERDQYLAHSLRMLARPLPAADRPSGRLQPPVVVGVVGMGHIQGIIKFWDKDIDIQRLLTIPETSRSSRLAVVFVKLTVLGLFGYGCYRCGKFAWNKLR